MSFIIYYIVPVVILINLMNRWRVRNVNIKFQYKFYNLKDELRWLVINNKISASNTDFIKLDTAISSASSRFMLINIYLLGYYLLFEKREKATIVKHHSPYKNQDLIADMHQKYGDLFYRYMLARYAYMIIFFGGFYWLLKRVIKLFANMNVDRWFVRKNNTIKDKVGVLGDFIGYEMAY